MTKIYFNQLEEGKVERFTESLSPQALEPHEAELTFAGEIEVVGQIYRAGIALVMDLEVKATAELPCAICNGAVQVEVSAKEEEWSEDVADYPKGEIDLLPVIREMVFLTLPRVAECEGGCPQRKELKSYLSRKEEEETYYPFRDL